MFGIGTPELVIFAIILLVLFGGAKLPGLMRNLGRSVNEFKAGIKEKPKDNSASESSRQQDAISNEQEAREKETIEN